MLRTPYRRSVYIESPILAPMQNGLDPYTPDEPLYECMDCGSRLAGGSGGSCGDCGGTLKNIAVPRE
jgi:hypothetical protein